MYTYQFEYNCSTSNKIRVGSRGFNSIDGLIRSGYTSGKTKELVGNYIYWWKNLTVMFPDKEAASAAFVECTHKQVAVGYPACYYTYNFSTVKEALTFAEYINSHWLKFTGNWKEFLNTKLDQVVEEFSNLSNNA